MFVNQKYHDNPRLTLLILSSALAIIFALFMYNNRIIAAPSTRAKTATPTATRPSYLPYHVYERLQEESSSYLAAVLAATRTPRPTNTRVVPTCTPLPTRTPTFTPTPLPTPDGVARVVKVPILMYHYIATPPDPTDKMRVALSTTPKDFAAQLEYLQAEGYETIKLADLVRHLQVGAPLPPKPIILTFDDGHLDHYTNAYRLLREYDFSGTFFVLTMFADENRADYLSWSQIKAMERGGMEIGSHGLNHVELRGQSVDYVIWQILGSKEALDMRLPEETRFFCYPAGKYDQQVIDLLHSAHYWGAVTTQQGITQASGSIFELRRIRMNGDDGVAGLAAKLELDWEDIENGAN